MEIEIKQTTKGGSGLRAIVGILLTPEVAEFYKLCVVEMPPANLQMDSWGIKRLFSHGLRRWLSGASGPRDPHHDLICILLIV